MKKLTKKDKLNIQNAYFTKQEEYSKLTLEELQELYPKLGGTYKIACNHVINQKLTDLRHELESKELEKVENIHEKDIADVEFEEIKNE